MLKCPWPNCKLQCTNKSNFKRHLRRHDEKGSLQRCRDKSMDKIKMYPCECGKEFRNLSALQYHQDTAHVIQYAEIICSEVGCYETFSDAASLKEHARLSHRYALCEVCGKSFLKRNLKRHYEAHNGAVKQSFYCPYANCSHGYTRKSNLTSHIKAVHLQVKPYSCSFENCGKRFAFKNVRDNHEKTAAHLPWLGDFISEEKKLLLKPKGGRKRMVFMSVDDLFLKRGRCSTS
ncbi:hypothetical protein O6H91_07G030400 [Diphasiastrum complanatum]|nr:hypothetical protein O6H91_07G030400 [Diphasiastrum complanatum]